MVYTVLNAIVISALNMRSVALLSGIGLTGPYITV